MIAFNGQYLSAASHGNMRITAACLGGQWVIAPWLTTQQAIIAAFGAEEGIAVISRTNDYLNQIATTDPQRAQQLAMFINEDPLLVCSLVETSKVRGIYPNAVGNYFDTGYNPTIAPTAEVLMRARNNNDTDYWGNSQIEGSCYYANFEKTLSYYRYGSSTSQNTGIALPIGELLQWSVGKEVRVNGELRYTCSRNYTPNASQKSIRIFNSWRNYPASFDLARFALRDGEDIARDFVPYRDPRTGEMELLDIVTLTLATRVGTFTEQLTDKTHA